MGFQILQTKRFRSKITSDQGRPVQLVEMILDWSSVIEKLIGNFGKPDSKLENIFIRVNSKVRMPNSDHRLLRKQF